MAIFSLNHSFIGRTTHRPGSASLYARYITRNGTCTDTLGARMPTARGALMAWLDSEEQNDRKNARVVDKLIVALPLELSHDQNRELLRAYAERMTDGRASWIAAIHDGPRDVDNPHAHIIFRDRDITTRKRVMLTTEKGSTQRFRDAWEQELNRALEREGRPERVDKRSLIDQGLSREAQLHVGAGAEALARKQFVFKSAEKEVTRLIDGVPERVTINYPVIDEGKTRFEENEARKERNRDRGADLPAVIEAERAALMGRIAAGSYRLNALYQRATKPGETPLDDADPIAATVRDHIAARRADAATPTVPPPWHAVPWEAYDPKFRYPGGVRPGQGAKRRGPYPGGPGKDAAWFEREQDKPTVGKAKARQRGVRKGLSSFLVGGGLSVAGKIAESLWSIFDGPSGPEREREDKSMADQRKGQDHVAEQQKREAAEVERWRKVELDLYLQQRDRERHHDRGR